MNPLVIYHGGCPDGFCAAWVAHRCYVENGQTPELYAARYGDDPPDVVGREVLIVDFSYPRNVLESMAQQAKSIRLFDHHKTCLGLAFRMYPRWPGASVEEVTAMRPGRGYRSRTSPECSGEVIDEGVDG